MNGEGVVIKRLVFISLEIFLLLGLSPVVGIVVETNYAGDVPMWDNIMSSEPAAEFTEIPHGVILPHHTITTTMAARFYKGLGRRVQPKSILLIGPNHYESGKSNIITAKDISFKTVYGNVEIDRLLLDNLANSQNIEIDDSVFIKEHAVYYHAPFIKKFFPCAKVIPVLIKWDTPRNELDELVNKLNQIVSDDVLVLASVDFSHYGKRCTANYHDYTSFAAIMNFDYDGIFTSEIDSPASIYVLEKIMSEKKCRRATRIYHTNSEDFVCKQQLITTSHQYFAFFSGEPVCQKMITIMIPGDIHAEKNELGIRTSWLWDRSYSFNNDKTVTRYLKNIRGEEDRFLTGYNLYLFDRNKSENIFNYKKNGLKISVINVDKSNVGNMTLVKENSINADCTIVVCNVLSENKNYYKKIARKFIDDGADIVLFRGVHNITGNEVYRKGLVLYSLGDFINPATDSSGKICQILFTENKIEYNFIPVKVMNGYPSEN